MPYPLYNFPTSSALQQRIAKSKLSIRVKPTARMRDLLVKHIERIDWAYLLAPHTINLAATKDVSEINVLSLKLHTPTCPETILRYLDKAIPKPTLFELRHGNQCCLTATYKRPSRAKPGEWVTYDYYASDWLVEDASLRQNLPHALDLGKLYQKLLSGLLPIAPESEETLDQRFERAAELSKLQRELEKLKKRHQREKQFNVRIELNARICALEEEIERSL